MIKVVPDKPVDRDRANANLLKAIEDFIADAMSEGMSRDEAVDSAKYQIALSYQQSATIVAARRKSTRRVK